MVSSDVTGQDLAKKLGRSVAYVSERINGKRALDTEDVDALALLAGGGWTGRTLMIELARRARAAEGDGQEGLPENVTRLDDHRFTPVDDERAVASEISEDDGSDEHYDD